MDYYRISGVAHSRRGVPYDVQLVSWEGSSEVTSFTEWWVVLGMACGKSMTFQGVTKIDAISKDEYDAQVATNRLKRTATKAKD